MTRASRRVALSLGILLAVMSLAAGVSAQEYKVEKFDAPPPQELAPAVRETLSTSGIRVTSAEGSLCEIWLRATLPARSTPSTTLGVAYGQFDEGTLFGAVRFVRELRDYRRQVVKPGVFTLRYALNPVDGNHMGVAPTRDFLLLLPAAEDTSPANLTRVNTVVLSKKSIGLNHPSVWSLVTGEGEHPAAPELEHRTEENLWVLYFRVAVQPAGGSPTAVLLGLVVAGHAPEA